MNHEKKENTEDEDGQPPEKKLAKTSVSEENVEESDKTKSD